MTAPETVTEQIVDIVPPENPQLTPEQAELYAQKFTQHRSELLSFARGITRDTNEAEDLVQEAFVNVMEKYDPAQKADALRPLLFKALRNHFIDTTRQTAGNRATPMDLTDEYTLSAMQDIKDLEDTTVTPRTTKYGLAFSVQQTSPEEIVVGQEVVRSRIAELIDKLGSRHGKDFICSGLACILLQSEGYDRNDIAPVLGIRTATVATQKRRVINHIAAAREDELISV